MTKDQAYHQIEIEVWADKQRFDAIHEKIDELIDTITEEGETIHISKYTNFLAKQLEREAITHYIEQEGFDHIIDVIKENGELHEYATARDEECNKYGEDCSEGKCEDVT
jgi:hypothetical protein